MQPKPVLLSLSLTVLALYAAPVSAATIPISSATTIVNVSAQTCFECWNDPNLPKVSIAAQLTVVPETGMFYHPFYQSYVYGSFLRVVEITGLLNGLFAMSLAFAPNGAAPWLYTDYTPGFVHFSAGSVDARIIFDQAYVLLQTTTSTGFGTNTPLRWNAVPVPDEASTLLLMTVSLVAIALRRTRHGTYAQKAVDLTSPTAR